MLVRKELRHLYLGRFVTKKILLGWGDLNESHFMFITKYLKRFRFVRAAGIFGNYCRLGRVESGERDENGRFLNHRISVGDLAIPILDFDQPGETTCSCTALDGPR